MKLGFAEAQTLYNSGSQNARQWTESWVRTSVYCPSCANTHIEPFPNNSKLADFHCTACNEEYELKSQRGKFGRKVLDGDYKTKCERLKAKNNPSLLLMNYDLKSLSVINLFIVPKHFFILDVIEKRPPLAASARRAGWIGSKILLDRIPDAGKIHIIQNGLIRSKEAVLEEWQKTLFLQSQTLQARGWFLDVLRCVESLRRSEFSLEDVYRFESHLRCLYPDNQNVRPKIRQQLQFLRDRGFIEFTSRAKYRLLSRESS